MKTDTESFRQFVVVCRVAVKLGVAGYSNVRAAGKTRVSLYKIGLENFDLTNSQIRSAIDSAKDEHERVIQADRMRKGGVRNMPTRSDEIIALLHKKAA